MSRPVNVLRERFDLMPSQKDEAKVALDYLKMEQYFAFAKDCQDQKPTLSLIALQRAINYGVRAFADGSAETRESCIRGLQKISEQLWQLSESPVSDKNIEFRNKVILVQCRIGRNRLARSLLTPMERVMIMPTP